MHESFEFIKESGGIKEYLLSKNGLRVLLVEDHSAPVVAVRVTYRVGSRNEAVGHTGSAHLLEHLLFKKFKTPDGEESPLSWSKIEDLGGNINAETWLDGTSYYEVIPSEYIEEALEFEGLRMCCAEFSREDHATEMMIVRNEYERGENDPIRVLDRHIWASAYEAHPYHHPTIGWKSDIENVSTQQLKKFYKTYYHPNNATLIVVGDFDPARIFELIEKNFAYASAQEIPEMYTSEPPQEGERRVVVRRAGQTNIVAVAHKTPPGLHADAYPMQVIARILAGGKSSRLYRALVETGLANEIVPLNYPFRDNALFAIYALLNRGVSHEEVEAIILAEYAKLQEKGVTDEELAIAKAQVKAESAFSRDGAHEIASNISEAVTLGDFTYYTTFSERIANVSASSILHAARTYLVPSQSTTGQFIAKKPKGEVVQESATPHEPEYWRARQHEHEGVRPHALVAPRVHESSPLPGIRLFEMQTTKSGAVTIEGSLLGGYHFSKKNPMIAAVLARMLDQGTKRLDKLELYKKLEGLGARINFSVDTYRVRFEAECLREHAADVIALMGEQLREPRLDEADLDTIKKQLISSLDHDKENTAAEAQTYFRRLLFSPEHPNYRLSAEEKIAYITQISIHDLEIFHQENYGLGSMLVVAAGDIEGTGVTDALEKSFGDWSSSQLKLPDVRIQPLSRNAESTFITVENKTSTDMYIGHALDITLAHPDYYALALALFALGGSSQARLFQKLREREGLTYGIYAGFAGMNFGDFGYWHTWGTFAPILLEKGIEKTREEISEWTRGGLTEEELAVRKRTVAGLYSVSLGSTDGLADVILSCAELGRPISYIDDYPNIIKKLTLTEVNESIKKHIQPNNLIMVAAGSIDSNGKPIS